MSRSEKRDYTIHLNMMKDCENFDVLEAYFFARVLDKNLMKSKGENFDEKLAEATFKTEKQCQNLHN